MRKTKIICTIGPVSENAEMLKELLLAGMNVARFNFSHGDYEEHRAKFERAVRIAKELNLPLATMMDTKGPEIRLRDFEGDKVYLESGQEFILTTEEIMGTSKRASITYKNLKNDVQKLLLSNGIMTKCHIEESKHINWKTKYNVTIVGGYNQQKIVDLCTESVKINNLKFKCKYTYLNDDLSLWGSPIPL